MEIGEAFAALGQFWLNALWALLLPLWVICGLLVAVSIPALIVATILTAREGYEEFKAGIRGDRDVAYHLRVRKARWWVAGTITVGVTIIMVAPVLYMIFPWGDSFGPWGLGG